MEQIKKLVQKFGKIFIIGAFLIFAFTAGNTTGHPQKVQVLGVSTHITPTPTSLPLPTSVPVTVINNIIVPTTAPAPSSVTPTPTPIVIIVTPTPTPSEQVTPTPTITPTPVTQAIEVDIDYAGEHAANTYTTSITAGETAWQAVQDAVGLANIHDTDYGGDLGIFITGFNGVDASSNQYFDFQVNGTSSNVGVSSYKVADHDILKFVLTSF